MASTVFTINGTTTPAEVIVAPGASVSLAVLSVDGLDSISWSAEASSDKSLTPPTITPAGTPLGATATFTMDTALGVSYRLLCTGNGNTANPVYARGIVSTANHFGASPLTLSEDIGDRDDTEGWLQTYNSSLEGKPHATGVLNTTDATTTTIDTIATFSNFVYVIGVVISSRQGTNITYEGTRFVYRNVGGTLTQVGFDVDDALNTDDIIVGGTSHTTSSTNILVQWTGKASTNIRSRYFVQVYQNMLDDYS